jgi:TolA-binding protein
MASFGYDAAFEFDPSFNLPPLNFPPSSAANNGASGSQLEFDPFTDNLFATTPKTFQPEFNFIPSFPTSSDQSSAVDSPDESGSVTTAPTLIKNEDDEDFGVSASPKKMKQLKNRISAKKYRDKKKVHMMELEERVSELEVEVKEKNRTIIELEQQNRILREQMNFFQKLFASQSGSGSSNSGSAFILGFAVLLVFALPFIPAFSSHSQSFMSVFSSPTMMVKDPTSRKILNVHNTDLAVDVESFFSGFRYYDDQDSYFNLSWLKSLRQKNEINRASTWIPSAVSHATTPQSEVAESIQTLYNNSNAAISSERISTSFPTL